MRSGAITAGCLLLGLAVKSTPAQDTASFRRPVTLLVWVISAQTGVPLEGTQVAMRLRGDSGGVTDSVGRALLRGIPHRPDTLVVRHPGYSPRSFPLALLLEDSLELTVALDPIGVVMLDPVLATGRVEPSPSLAPGFSTRRKQGNGHFLDRSDIDKRNLHSLPELLRTVPGIRLETGRQGGRWLRSTRSGLAYDCPMALYVDGAVVTSETTTRAVVNGRRVVQRGSSIFDAIPADMIEAIEVYTTSNVPAQFNHGESACGVVLLWMRPSR